ncbi:HPP family protein [Haloarcula nitratireducens]|uniref:HPP family protein n=1 Tax=Haloarcula nitratireducens TaxID=2487749 RepID=A0AAW4PAL9_9EURY|nr:HPP family protein [Halomicroarcula nitratireducens]MBX0294919.1 HPP family protein [Halomicroarcula nitratireducens]
MEVFEPLEEQPTTSDALLSTGRTCSLLLLLVLLAWGTGQPFLFPSLGPSAYALAVTPSAATSQWQRALGGHFFGVVSGLLAYHTIAPGLSVTKIPPAMSMPGLQLVAAGFLSVGLTSFAMLRTDLRHAPACATTLIVGLGLLTSALEAGIILFAICVLVVADHVLPTTGVEEPPQ